MRSKSVLLALTGTMIFLFFGLNYLYSEEGGLALTGTPPPFLVQPLVSSLMNAGLILNEYAFLVASGFLLVAILLLIKVFFSSFKLKNAISIFFALLLLCFMSHHWYQKKHVNKNLSQYFHSSQRCSGFLIALLEDDYAQAIIDDACYLDYFKQNLKMTAKEEQLSYILKTVEVFKDEKRYSATNLNLMSATIVMLSSHDNARTQDAFEKKLIRLDMLEKLLTLTSSFEPYQQSDWPMNSSDRP